MRFLISAITCCFLMVFGWSVQDVYVGVSLVALLAKEAKERDDER